MKRNLASRCVLVCALVLSSVAPAASAEAASTPSFRVVAHGSATGTITALSGSSFTIQTAGRRTGVVNALTAAAAHVTGQDYPYVYGGGHAQAGIASIGIKGPGLQRQADRLRLLRVGRGRARGRGPLAGGRRGPQ